ncbi:MAG: hypothetical protein ACRDCH_01125 [Metamycoplasmataceae bacterium]
MISNIKKMALGIMSIGGIVVPLAVVASCGSTAKDVNLVITDKTNPVVTEQDIAGDNYKSLATLEKIFDGITANDLANVTVTKETVNDTDYVIVLTAKEGYTIGGQTTLRSKTFKLAINMEITAKTSPVVRQEDIEGEQYKTLATLVKIFDGITVNDLDNLTVTIEGPVANNYVITLTAKEGYAINGQRTYKSTSFSLSAINMEITAKTNPVVRQDDIEGEKYKTLATLEKLFDGISASDLDNLTVTIEGPVADNYAITLTAKDGYAINGERTLKSTSFALLAVDMEITAKTLTSDEIKAIDVDNDAFKSYATLQKLFVFDTAIITQELLNRAVVVTMTPMTGNQPRIVTLTANNGYAINGMSSLNSNEFIIPINYVINKASTVPTDIKPSDIENDNYKRLSVISKLFTGPDISEAMIANLDIELITVTAGQSYQIKLTPKTDVWINGGITPITSDTFTLFVRNVVISNKPTVPTDITQRNLEDTTYIHSLEFLNKLFNLGSLTQADIDNNINVTFANAGGIQHRIILTAKSDDFRMNGRTTHDSNIFNTVVNVIVSKIDNPMISTFDTGNDTALKSLATIRKVFNIDPNLTQAQMDARVSVTFTNNDGNDFITLTAKPGFVINDDSPSIQSATFTQKEGIPGIRKEAQLATLHIDDLANPSSHKVVNNFFSEITDQAMINQNMTVRLNTLGTNLYTLTLIANEGKMFKGGPEITSIQFSVNTVRNIGITRLSNISNPPTANDLVEPRLSTVFTLSKFFAGITNETLTRLQTVEYIRGAGTSNHFVKLTAKDGWAFEGGATTLTSLGFRPVG